MTRKILLTGFVSVLTLGLTWLVACGPAVTGPGASGDDDDDTATPTETPSESVSETPTAPIFLQTCATAGGETMGYTDTLTCADTVGELQWDWYIFPVVAGDCIDIWADNGAGAADLLAFAQDVSGPYYGLQDDYSQLDDERACTTDPWFAGSGCPAASLTASVDGDFTVAVGQWAGGCADNAEYTVYIAVNGTDMDLSGGPSLQDTPFAE